MNNRLVAQMTHRAMGTIMTHKAYGQHAENSLEAAHRDIAQLEGRLSRFLPNSDISRVNRSAGRRSEKVSFETYTVLSKAVEFSRRFPGCFDVTIAPLVNLWHTTKEELTPPAASSIQQTLPLVNYQDLILDPQEMTAELKTAGQAIDLGGMGKGFAGDRIQDVFKEFGIASAYSNLGGNVVTVGAKPDGTPWQIGIQHPRRENDLMGAVSVENEAVVTSGDYQRYFIDAQGKRHHHILDPRTGYPADSGLISVSIITERAFIADMLSTIVFVAGMEKGLEFLKNFPQTEAILVDSEVQVYVTPGLKYRFQVGQGVEVTILN